MTMTRQDPAENARKAEEFRRDPYTHRGLAGRLAIRYCVAMAERDDAVEDMLTYCWSMLDRYDPAQSAFSNWATTVMRNRLFRIIGRAQGNPIIGAASHPKQAQKRTHRGVMPLDAAESRTPPDRHDTQAEVEARLDAEAAMGSLSPIDRHVLERRFWLDETLGEIGDDLGITRQAVEQRQQRAISRLREMFA